MEHNEKTPTEGESVRALVWSTLGGADWMQFIKKSYSFQRIGWGFRFIGKGVAGLFKGEH